MGSASSSRIMKIMNFELKNRYFFSKWKSLFELRKLICGQSRAAHSHNVSSGWGLTSSPGGNQVDGLPPAVSSWKTSKMQWFREMPGSRILCSWEPGVFSGRLACPGGCAGACGPGAGGSGPTPPSYHSSLARGGGVYRPGAGFELPGRRRT